MSSDKKFPLSICWPELITGLIIWAIVGMIFLATIGMPIYTEKSPGPRFLPVIVGVSLGILTILYWVTSYRKPKQRVKFPDIGELVRPAGFIAISFLTVILWERFGAVLTVMIVCILELKFLERYSWIRSVLVALIISLFAWGLFHQVLGIELSKGVLIKMLFGE